MWIMIFILACIVFFNRYIMLSPYLEFKWPEVVQRMLNYAAPCLLSAICVPVIFFDGETVRELSQNNYFYAAIFCLIISNFIKNVLMNVGLSIGFFYLLLYFNN